MLPVSAFPMSESESVSVGRFLAAFSVSAAAHFGLVAEVFIHLSYLQHKDGSAVRFSAHGREWFPRMGLGVWPDRPAPTIWTPKDFANLVPGEKLRTLRNHVFQITRSPEAREEARHTMLGWGSVIQIMLPATEKRFFDNTRALLLPRITDPCFNCFPYYLPLLERKSLGVHTEALESWICGASIYLRESPEDTGVLIVSRVSLQPILETLGAELQDHNQLVWSVSLARL
jgi:hypothetical protein